MAESPQRSSEQRRNVLFECDYKNVEDKIRTPDDVLTKLHRHQKQALFWMRERENFIELPPFWEERNGGRTVYKLPSGSAYGSISGSVSGSGFVSASVGSSSGSVSVSVGSSSVSVSASGGRKQKKKRRRSPSLLFCGILLRYAYRKAKRVGYQQPAVGYQLAIKWKPVAYRPLESFQTVTNADADAELPIGYQMVSSWLLTPDSNYRCWQVTEWLSNGNQSVTDCRQSASPAALTVTVPESSMAITQIESHHIQTSLPKIVSVKHRHALLLPDKCRDDLPQAIQIE
ncbi:hypothetical protein TIFTF001_024777 [Ficus carica]|uniref:Uncharacterized protein n=1 Tax=Ficus carica TaxID=3494 RepID=A0AA88AYA4_FICCA|nr:hypothetical protein TIFTF001_024777 [Ficus carica]